MFKVNLNHLLETSKLIPDEEVVIRKRSKINCDEIIAGQEFVEDIQCNICFEIPLQPISCDQCDAIMCYDCLANYIKIGQGDDKAEKCPLCK